MDAKTLLAMRIQTLLQEVWRSEQAINADQLDATLRGRVQARFSHRFNQQRKALKQLETESGHRRAVGYLLDHAAWYRRCLPEPLP